MAFEMSFAFLRALLGKVLKKENDEGAKRSLAALEESIAKLEREAADLEEKWKAEKAGVQGSAGVKEELDRARTELEAARRAGDLARMAELQYGRIPELEKRLSSASDQARTHFELLRNSVTENEIGLATAVEYAPSLAMLEPMVQVPAETNATRPDDALMVQTPVVELE